MTNFSQNQDQAGAPGGAGAAIENKREILRLRMEMPVLYCLPGESSYRRAKTIEIGVSGGLLVIPNKVKVQAGQSLLLINPRSSSQTACHVRYSHEKQDGQNHVGIEFVNASSQFWGSALFSMEPGTSADSRDRNAAPTAGAWRAVGLASGALVVLLLAVTYLRPSPTPAHPAPSASVDIAPEKAALIPDIEGYRLAAAGDFDPDLSSWITTSGHSLAGEIPGAFSAFGESLAYVLVGEDQMRRVVIVANGRLRCDAQYKSVALVARIPQERLRRINWADPPPDGIDGDGLLVVRSAKDPRSGVVLFLQGEQVVSATPTDYRLLLINQRS